MNQEKIGALIASLRKKQGLTQSQLGAKVGVGDRAVSKWERGITCPDISIINELSSVLGITSDELLKGELTKEHKEQLKNHKFNKKLSLLIPLVLVIIAAFIIIYNKNKTYVYNLKSEDDKYDVVGKIMLNRDNTTIIINNITFKDKDINQILIKNYEYKIRNNKRLILRNGYINATELFSESITIGQCMQTLNINYTSNTKIDIKTLLKEGVTIELTFLKADNNLINKEIYLVLEK